MTVGSYTRGAFVPNNYYFNGSYQGTVQVGSIRSKTWSGGDASGGSAKPAFTKRYYTVPVVRVSKRGKVYNGSTSRSFRDYGETSQDVRLLTRSYLREHPLAREKRDRGFHAYSMSYSINHQPVMGPVSSINRNAAGQITASGTFTGISTSLISYNDTLPVPSFTANDQIALIGKLREQLRGSDFNMSVFLGEGHQSLRMIADATVKLARAYQLARRGDLVSAAKTLTAGRKSPARANRKRVASNWLELQYGWMPLLQDMRDGAVQLSHLLHIPFSRRHVVRRTVGGTVDQLPLVHTFGGRVFYFAKCYSLTSRQIVAYISEPESIPTVSGILDPELVAWELIPFSFVVDWFLPFGAYLEARAFANRLQGTFITTDFHRRHKSGFLKSTSDLGSGAYHTYAGDDSGSVQEWGSVSRGLPTTTLAVPMPEVKPFAKVASWKHCANALALFTGVFTKNELRSQKVKLVPLSEEVLKASKMPAYMSNSEFRDLKRSFR